MGIADIEHILLQPVQGKTRLVLQPDDLQVLTSLRVTDARTALTRGVKEYLEQLSFVGAGGREIKFKKVLHTWAESEVPADYPSAVVFAVDVGTYDYDRLTPRTFDLPDGYGIRQVAEFTIPVMVEMWSTDPIERMNIVSMLEDAFEPVDWMTGFRLELPHYHGARATFEKTALAYLDVAEDNQRRWRKAVISLTANVTQYVGLGSVIPRLRVRTVVEAVDEAGQDC